MAELDELGRSLALAKSALGAPDAARARVRARLVSAESGSSNAASPGGASAGATGRTAPFAAPTPSGVRVLARAVAWTSVGLCAGYWLGFHRIGVSLVEPARSEAAVQAAPASTSGASPRARSVAPAPAAAASGASAPAAPVPAVSSVGSSVPDAERATETEPVAGSTSERSSARMSPPARASAPRRHPAVTASHTPPRGEDTLGSSEDTLGAEIALLERAERAIRAGDGALALVFIEQLEREFSASPLHEERAVARILARCVEARMAGPAERTAARALAEQFLVRGSSVYAERVRELCELGEEN